LENDFRDRKDWALTTKEDLNERLRVTLREIILENKLTYITFLKIDVEGQNGLYLGLMQIYHFLNITKLIAIEIHDEFNIRPTIYQIFKEYGFCILN
jgi:hypothetical protein